MALAERGVQVRLINTRELGVIRPIDVMGQVDEQTRLVALASCHFVSGHRLDYQAIGKFLRKRTILFCVVGKAPSVWMPSKHSAPFRPRSSISIFWRRTRTS